MTSDNSRLTLIRRSYVAAVVCVGVGVVVHSLGVVSAQTVDIGWVCLALLTLISGSFTVRIPGATSTISVSETFVIIAAVRYGPGPAALLVALEGLIVSLWILKNSKEVYRVFFNMATGGVSVWLSAHLFFALTPQPLVLDNPASVVQVIPALFLFASIYFLTNSWLIAIAIGLDTGRSVIGVWRNSFVLLSLNYVSGASLAALLLPFIESIGLGTITLIAPLMILAYVTFRTAMGRIADANSHLSELNKLYLSTIETLAMAIDAKDQITHGHVRRVQAYAMGLARAVGVTSESDLKAIEAAALLHDMGKLAIPEHILNKPGKLTTAEFETMKQHANIGADILSAIEFPYPVVPIVRYHHENWNGHGYPTGLSEDSIPIGARILAVVDCFDALTSDRPYRPRLPDTEALQILRERSGKMYDPALVETFTKIYRSIAPPEVDFDSTDDPPGKPADVNRDGDVPSQQATLDSISASTAEARMLYELGQVIGSEATVAETAEVIFSHLRRCVPASSLVLFAYDQTHDQIVARRTSGEHAGSMLGMRIGLGQRISGWVAANRRTALNSDPALDLGDIARTRSPRLLSCLSTAIETSESLVGVITLYSTQKDAFSDQQSRVVQLVAAHAAEALRHRLCSEAEGSSLEANTEGVVNGERLQRSFDHARFRSERSGVSVVVILTRDLSARERSAGIADSIRPLLRATDELFRSGPEELVVIMSKTDNRSCRLVTEHIYDSLVSKTSISGLTMACASWPDEGDSLLALVQTARSRLGQALGWSPKQPSQNPAVH